MKAMRKVLDTDGAPCYEEVAVLELGHGDYVVVRQIWSGRSFKVLKKQLFPLDEGLCSR